MIKSKVLDKDQLVWMLLQLGYSSEHLINALIENMDSKEVYRALNKYTTENDTIYKVTKKGEVVKDSNKDSLKELAETYTKIQKGGA